MRLTSAQCAAFLELTQNGHVRVKWIRQTQVLVWRDSTGKAAEMRVRESAGRLRKNLNSFTRFRKRFVVEGEGPAPNRKVRETPAVEPKRDGRVEAQSRSVASRLPKASLNLEVAPGRCHREGW